MKQLSQILEVITAVDKKNITEILNDFYNEVLKNLQNSILSDGC